METDIFHLSRNIQSHIVILEVFGKAPSLSKSKVFLKKVSCPITRYPRAWQAQGYSIDLHWIFFQESCHSFWVWKMQLSWLQVVSDIPKVWKPFGIGPFIKAAHGCQNNQSPESPSLPTDYLIENKLQLEFSAFNWQFNSNSQFWIELQFSIFIFHLGECTFGVKCI